MGWRADTEPHDVMQFLRKGLVTRQFEAAPAVRRKPCSCQILTTEEAAIPMSLAIARTVPVRGLLPGRFQRQHDELINQFRVEGGRLLSRRRPSTRSAMKRSCHRHTQVCDLPVAAMIATVPSPSSLIRMISARHTCFCGEPRFATMASSRIL